MGESHPSGGDRPPIGASDDLCSWYANINAAAFNQQTNTSSNLEANNTAANTNAIAEAKEGGAEGIGRISNDTAKDEEAPEYENSDTEEECETHDQLVARLRRESSQATARAEQERVRANQAEVRHGSAKGIEGDAVLILSDHDVICGRGSGPNNHPGNVNFRKLILSRKAEYKSTTNRAEKARIAQEIVEHVQGNPDTAGRFLKLRRFEEGRDIWVILDQNTALEKARCALRQKWKQAEKAQAQANAASKNSVTTALEKAKQALRQEWKQAMKAQAQANAASKNSVTNVSIDSQKSSCYSSATSAAAAAAAAPFATEQTRGIQPVIQHCPSSLRHSGGAYQYSMQGSPSPHRPTGFRIISSRRGRGRGHPGGFVDIRSERETFVCSSYLAQLQMELAEEKARSARERDR